MCFSPQYTVFLPKTVKKSGVFLLFLRLVSYGKCRSSRTAAFTLGINFFQNVCRFAQKTPYSFQTKITLSMCFLMNNLPPFRLRPTEKAETCVLSHGFLLLLIHVFAYSRFSPTLPVSVCFFFSTAIAFVITAGTGTPISPAFSVMDMTSLTMNAMHTPSRR